MKQILIELGGFEPSNITGNNENFMPMARINSKPVFVANVTADLGVERLGNHIVNEKVDDAMDKLISQLE